MLITGGTITTDGDYTVHTFTEDGTFSVSGGPLTASVLVVAGGGGGSTGGGGAGGLLYQSAFFINAGSYDVIVGDGGNAGDRVAQGSNGDDSIFSSLTAAGGGGGGGDDVTRDGLPGGSGGGGGSAETGYASGGYPDPEGQGNEGGFSRDTEYPDTAGGGGAGESGWSTDWPHGGEEGVIGGGDGGDGLVYSISGSSVYYAGGGGGNGLTVGSTKGIGGLGGGGDGVQWYPSIIYPTAGTINIGGGGGGGFGSNIPAKNGGSGIIIIRYETSPESIVEIPITKPSTEEIIDYGKKPYINAGESQSDMMVEITEQYVKSLGYNEPTIDFKQPYLYKSYHEMMHLFDTESLTGGMGTVNPIVNSTPGKYDPLFSYSPQLASLDNFNAYANYNYRLMGKTFPAGRKMTTPVPNVGLPEDEYIVYETLSMDTQYGSKHQILSVGSVRLLADNYKWTLTGVGVLSNTTGLSVSYYAPNMTMANINIKLSVGTRKRDKITIHLFYPV